MVSIGVSRGIFRMLQQRRDQVRGIVARAGVDHGEDVRMLRDADEPRHFTGEAVARDLQHLDSHFLSGALLDASPDLGIAALAEHTGQTIAGNLHLTSEHGAIDRHVAEDLQPRRQQLLLFNTVGGTHRQVPITPRRPRGNAKAVFVTFPASPTATILAFHAVQFEQRYRLRKRRGLRQSQRAEAVSTQGPGGSVYSAPRHAHGHAGERNDTRGNATDATRPGTPHVVGAALRALDEAQLGRGFSPRSRIFSSSCRTSTMEAWRSLGGAHNQDTASSRAGETPGT